MPDASLRGEQDQWHTPLYQAAGCTTQKRCKPERKKRASHRNPPPDRVQCLSSHIPAQSPSGILQQALLLTHLPAAAGGGRCSGTPGNHSVRRLEPRGGEEGRRRRRRWHATEAELTWILGEWVLDIYIYTEMTCRWLFFANSRIRKKVHLRRSAGRWRHFTDHST